ncbi:MAG: hypothetical protein MJ199_01375, partial [Bacilli bacterium]|nr:hypothetical protein [Bacilli bacterium]
MKFNKKIAVLLPTIVFASSITSCNKGNGVNLDPLPTTFFNVEVEGGDTVEFRCNNDARLTVDWGDGTIDNEKKHTYLEENYCAVQISGNLNNLSFSDENGEVYQKANNTIHSIILSNTVTSLPSHGFNIAKLRKVYL